MTILRKFFQHNWVATLYFNFRMLPFRQAIHLPFDFTHAVRFDSLRGRVRLEVDGPLHRAMVRFGGRGSDIFPRIETVLSLDGELVVRGDGVEIGMGTSCVVLGDARLVLDARVCIGAMSHVYCSRLIEMGERVTTGWECQIFDTNFHTMRDRVTGTDIAPEGVVYLRPYCWMGNRCNVMRGTVTPPHIIVASNSMLNRDYSAVEPYSLLAGMPARVVRTGIERVYENPV